MSEPIAEPIPAATVVLLRDGPGGVETLMLRRNSKISFGGLWVFPGGRIEPGDHGDDGDDGDDAAARRAAARETFEECGLAVSPSELVPLSFWLPPPVAPRRFATWFFLCRASEGVVAIDGAEIHEHSWQSPASMLALRDAGQVDLAPPTWVTLHHLGDVGEVAEALERAASQPELPRFHTMIHASDDGAVATWAEDAAYDSGDLAAPGGRHRLWMTQTAWRYERTGRPWD